MFRRPTNLLAKKITTITARSFLNPAEGRNPYKKEDHLSFSEELEKRQDSRIRENAYCWTHERNDEDIFNPPSPENVKAAAYFTLAAMSCGMAIGLIINSANHNTAKRTQQARGR